jgi:hypothetical protein
LARRLLDQGLFMSNVKLSLVSAYGIDSEGVKLAQEVENATRNLQLYLAGQASQEYGPAMGQAYFKMEITTDTIRAPWEPPPS